MANIIPRTDAAQALDTWKMARSGPRFNELIGLMEIMLDDARELYVEQAASEFNRGKVKALKEVVHFLKTGETP